MHRTCFLFIFILFISAAFPAAGLAVGEPAPPLHVGEWVKPSPVELLDLDGDGPKPFFLIDFWATWCQPCHRMMPHLTRLQRRYAEAGFVVIGVSNERAETVRRFVTSARAGMGYAVITDTESRDTYNAYMRPMGSPGIPHAFLIDRDGKLVWHGVPVEKEIAPIIQRMAGKDYTLKSEQLAQRAERLIARYFATLKRGEEEKAAQIGERIVEWGSARPGMLREFAWRILTDNGLETRNAETALAAATVAAQAAPDDFRALETLARAQFESGNVAEAVETQKKAITACPEAILQERMERTLDKFLSAHTEEPASL
ncbi:MAG: TlpA disulfide reductase family protein [Candidatus Hydrogenedentota bacterium]